MGAHRGLDRRRWPARSVGVEVRRRDSGGAGTELAVRAVACSSGLRISTGGLVGFLRTRAGGQEDSEMAGGEQSRRGLSSPELELGHDSGEAKV